MGENVEQLHQPLAFHITFGTYGTRLHGDPRGTVDRGMNKPGDPIIGEDPGWWSLENNRLNFLPVLLNDEQMGFVEQVVPSICDRGKWKLHTCAGGPNHVHAILATSSEGQAVRKWFKRWLGEALSARWPLQSGATWWSEGGSVKWIWTHEYFESAYKYVDGQRAIR
jgi:REP element-mobilizing transposase RayT